MPIQLITIINTHNGAPLNFGSQLKDKGIEAFSETSQKYGGTRLIIFKKKI